MEYADEIVKYCDSMVDNWSRLYDLTQESFSKSIKIIKYEDLQMNYQNEIKDALLFLKLNSAKFDPFPIFGDSLSLSLRRNIYKVSIVIDSVNLTLSFSKILRPSTPCKTIVASS